MAEKSLHVAISKHSLFDFDCSCTSIYNLIPQSKLDNEFSFCSYLLFTGQKTIGFHCKKTWMTPSKSPHWIYEILLIKLKFAK